MTEKMMLFCEEYLKDKELNASAAYKRVYKTCKSDMTARSNASKLLKRPDVREYIQKKQAEIHDKNTADIKEIEEYLTSVVRGKSKSEVLKLNGDGYQVVVEKHPEEKDRIRAAELLGKR